MMATMIRVVATVVVAATAANAQAPDFVPANRAIGAVQLVGPNGALTGAGNPVAVAGVPTPVTCTNRGGSIAASGVAQQAAAANAGRKALIIRNPATATEVLTFDVAATASAASWDLPPGVAFTWAPGTIPVSAVSVYAATAGHVFLLLECQ